MLDEIWLFKRNSGQVATKAFAAYLSRSDQRETAKAFGEVIGRLRNGSVGNGGLKPGAATDSDRLLLEAFEAEGLLNLWCVVLAPS